MLKMTAGTDTGAMNHGSCTLADKCENPGIIKIISKIQSLTTPIFFPTILKVVLTFLTENISAKRFAASLA